jgi:hypothetical protein
MESYSTQPTSTPLDIDKLPPAWYWRDVGTVALLVLAGFFLAMWSISALIGPDARLTSPLVYVATIVIYGLLLAGVYLFAVRRAGWRAVGWQAADTQTLVITTPLMLLLALCGMVLINLLVALLQGGSFENPQHEALTGGEALSNSELALLFLLVAGLVPIAEELFFRGMIYPLLRARWGAYVAIIASAALFAVVHVIPTLLPALFFVGLVLGLLREWSKSVIPGILLHATQNGLALLAIQAAMLAP